MASNNERIEQFRKMTEADPQNELGHFSLGRAYIDAGQNELAIPSLRRALQINPNLSKAYQLIATALLAQKQNDQAIATLTDGVKVAETRGEAAARREMVEMLQKLGVTVSEPSSSTGAAPAPVGEGQVQCKRCGKVAPKLPKPPFRNQFGQDIYANTCAPCWREAIGVGTKVINELRLPMADPQAQKIWDQHIREFLNL